MLPHYGKCISETTLAGEESFVWCLRGLSAGLGWLYWDEVTWVLHEHDNACCAWWAREPVVVAGTVACLVGSGTNSCCSNTHLCQPIARTCVFVRMVRFRSFAMLLQVPVPMPTGCHQYHIPVQSSRKPERLKWHCGAGDSQDASWRQRGAHDSDVAQIFSSGNDLAKFLINWARSRS